MLGISNAIQTIPLSAKIVTQPSTVAFLEGSALNTSGISVKIVMDNGAYKVPDTITYSVNAGSISQLTTSSTTVTVTATYKNQTFTTSYGISVYYATQIAVTTYPTTLSYKKGDALNTSGLVVTATYSNGTTATVSTMSLSVPSGNINNLQKTDTTVTITATIGLRTLTTSYAITVTAGRFVTVGASGTSYYSTDGLTWTAMSGLGDYEFKSVAYGNNMYVAVADYGQIYYSTNGETWTSCGIVVSNDYEFRSVTYGNGKFVAVAHYGNSGRTYFSTNGTTWTATADPAGYEPRVMYNGSQFVVSSAKHEESVFSETYTPRFKVSTTGSGSWTTYDAESPYSSSVLYPTAVAYSGTKYVVVFDGSYYAWYATTYLSNLTQGGTYFSQSIIDVIYDTENSNFALIGKNKETNLYTSPEGDTWTSHNMGASGYKYGITKNNDIWVSVGANGNIFYCRSPYTDTWSIRTTGVSSNLYSVCYGEL